MFRMVATMCTIKGYIQILLIIIAILAIHRQKIKYCAHTEAVSRYRDCKKQSPPPPPPFLVSKHILLFVLSLDWPSPPPPRRKKRLIEGNAKCRHLKKFTCKGQVFICMRRRTPYPPPLTHCIRVYKSWTREKIWGATVYKAGSKIPTWLTVSPAYKLC
jgi:hypothetical protein